MGKSSPAKLDETKRTVHLRKALVTGLQGPDVDNFDIEKVKRTLMKRRRRSSRSAKLTT
jgi:hypothetical protein